MVPLALTSNLVVAGRLPRFKDGLGSAEAVENGKGVPLISNLKLPWPFPNTLISRANLTPFLTTPLL